MTMGRIFGREPAAWSGLIQAVLALALSLDMFALSNERVGLIMAVVSAVFGVYTAWVTASTMLGVIVGLANAAFALAAGYGFKLSTTTTAAAIGLVTVAVGFFQRTQTSPPRSPLTSCLPPRRPDTAKPAHPSRLSGGGAALCVAQTLRNRKYA
jgi:hypothetical protein